MGIAIQSPERYEASLRKLFPQGAYWDRQFADPQSDCSLFCKAKLDEFIRFRKRMSDLQNESMIQSAVETLDDWERALMGNIISTGLTTGQRQTQLVAAKTGNVSMTVIKEIARVYGITITDIRFPFRPAFFGFSRFGIDRASSPAAFSVLFIYTAATPDGTTRAQFEKQLAGRLLVNYIVYFMYGELSSPQEGGF
jgi:uncharacterized protein YmfQ (DUF2313 family)